MIKFNGVGSTVAWASSIKMVFIIVDTKWRQDFEIRVRVHYKRVVYTIGCLHRIQQRQNRWRSTSTRWVLGTAIQAFLGPKKDWTYTWNSECTVGEAILILGPRPVCWVPCFSATRWIFGSFDRIDERGPSKITFAQQVENWITKQEVETEKWYHRLASIQLGWEASYAQQLRVAFVNTLANTLDD